MIKIMIVEDNAMVRELTQDMLSKNDDFEVTGTADNGVNALHLLTSGVQADIILADLNMKGMDGIELTEHLSAHYQDIKVIVLTMHAKAAFQKRAMEAGAKGYILKNGDIDELYTAIRKVYSGETVIGSELL